MRLTRIESSLYLRLACLVIGIATASSPVMAQGIITTLAGSPYSTGFSGDGGPAAAATFSGISSPVVDSADNIYFADGNRIRRIGADGNVTTIAGNGVPGGSGDGGPALNASIGAVYQLAINGQFLFFGDNYEHKIRVINLISGTIDGYGTGTSGTGGDGGSIANASFMAPWGVAFDDAGNFYIADNQANSVRRVAPNGTITMFVGPGPGYSGAPLGDGGPALGANILMPRGIYYRNGGLYIADLGNNRIRRVDLSTGIISTVAGNGTTTPGTDGGSALMAGIAPSWIAVDPSGNLFLTSQGSICRVDPAGVFTTIANPSNSSGIGYDYIPATQTVFSGVFGLAWDVVAQRLLISDGGNRLRQIFYTPPTTTTLFPSPNPVNGNQNVILTASVSPVDATGSIRFYYNYPYPASQGNWIYLGSAPVVNGTATFNWTAPTGNGTWSLSAVYAGDHTHNLSQSAIVSEVVQSGGSSVNLTSSANPSVYGGVVTLTATASPATATGTVQFLDGTTVLGSATVSGGSAVLTIATLMPGPHSLTAVYGGDANNPSSTSPVLTQTVNKLTAAVMLVSSLNPSNSGQTVTFTATVSPAAATGTITFLQDATNLGAVALTGGTAAVSTAAIPPGTHMVAAVYSGDMYFANTSSPSITQVVNVVNPAVAPGYITTIAGTGFSGTGGTGGPAVNAQLTQPGAMGMDSSGNLYVADAGNNRVVRIDTNGILTVFAGTGAAGYGGDGGPATAALLNGPWGIAIDAANDVFLSEAGGNRVRRVDGQTGMITTVAGNGTCTFSGDGGPAQNAGLCAPAGLALDSGSNLFIADYYNGRVRRVDVQTGLISTVAGNGAANGYMSPVPDGTPALQGWLSYPMWVSFDRSGYLLISENGSASIQRVDAAGTLRLVAGNGQGTFTGDGVPATNTGLGRASNVVTDAAGNLIFGDLNGRVRRIDASSGLIYTIAGNGQSTGGAGSCKSGSIGDGGPSTQAILDGVVNVLALSNGNLLLSDTVDCRVRLVGLPSPHPYTATNLTANPSSVSPGQSVTLTASVSSINVSGTPSGTVQFVDAAYNQTVLGTAALSGGTATLTLNSLAGGGHSVVAYYSGDSNFNNSASPWTAVWVLTPTTISVTSTPNPVTQYQGATFTISIPQLPAQSYSSLGTVTLMDGGVSIGSVLLFSNQVQLSAVFTAAGNHSITAVYGGSGTYAASTSAVLTQVVQAATRTTVASSANLSAFGQNVTFTATVTPSAATGTVQFLDGATVLGTGTISGGSAALTVSTLAAGSHSITAVYSGDSNNATSTSAALTQTVNQGATSVALASSTNPSAFGQNVTFTATVTPSAATGIVQFLDGTTALGTGTISGGSAALAVSTLAGGSHSITAIYSGDSNNATSTSAALTQTVNKGVTSVALASSASPSTFGQSVTFTATVTPGAATGTVQFLDGTTVLGTTTISGGAAALGVSTFAAGVHSITAVYSGDTNDATSTSAVLTQTVNQGATSVAMASSANPSTFGQSVTFTATVTPSSATGTVQFLDGTTVLGTTTISSGSAALAVSTLAAGAHSITAVYSGDANNATSTSAVLTQVVNKAATTVTVAPSANPSTFGQSVTFTATITPSTATGTVQFLDGATVLGTATISGGSAALGVSSLATGSHSITAVYSGDANNATSTSAVLTQTINKAATTVTVATSANPSTVGQSVTFTAAVTPNSATGTVQFLDGTSVLGTATISSGSAALAVSSLAAGPHSITAVYGGDANNATSTSAVLTQTINKATTTVTVATSANPSTFGQSVTFSVQVSPSAATGTVQVLDGSTAIGTITLSGGAGALSTSALAAGSHSVTVVYSGDASYSGSTSAAVAQTVNRAPSTIAAASSSNPSTFGQGVTFTATVSPSAAGGTVQFLDGGAVIGTAAVTSGVAALATSALGAGTHSITAVYSGDASYSGSTSAALGQTVNKAAAVIVVASSANPANYGQPVTFTAAITPATATGPVQFLDGGTLLGTANVMSGAATLTTSSLAAGSHSISAVYSGDANYLGASAGLSQTVKPTTTTSLTSNTTSITYGQTVNFTATVSSSAATGTVLFLDGAVTLGSAVLSNGQAKLSIATLSAGSHSVTAVYSGDAADSPSASSARIVSVVQAKPSINLSVSPNPATAGETVTCTAKVSPNSATGTVAFYDGATLLGTGTLSRGTATYATSALTGGNHAITAVYNGDTNFVSVTSNKSNLKVN